MPAEKVAMLTAGGLAPCLSSALGGLIQSYSEVAPDVELIGYLSGYKGLLLGQSLKVTPEVGRRRMCCISNSRVKLTNVAECVKRALVRRATSR